MPVVGYATAHTCGELRRWLHQLIDRLEPDDVDEAEAARANRSVDVQHLDHGMSLVSGRVPTTAAVAIGKRLRLAAKAMTDPVDRRTRDQKQAELFVSWLTNATGTDCDQSTQPVSATSRHEGAQIADRRRLRPTGRPHDPPSRNHPAHGLRRRVDLASWAPRDSGAQCDHVLVTRTHADRCPGVLRPWIAEDGAIVRLRLIGGALSTTSLDAVIDIADEHGDGEVLLTKRTNLQLRGIGHEDGAVSPDLVDAISAAGLLPSPSHELIRNIMVSPLTGLSGGQVDLRPVARELDRLLCAEPMFADLAGRFLFVLDDGRGDVAARSLDLGLMAVDDAHVQLRVGTDWGPVIELHASAQALADYAERFLGAAADATPHDGAAPWHVDELPGGGLSLIGTHFARDARTHVSSLPVPHGIIESDDGRRIEHLAVIDGILHRDLVDEVLARAGTEVVVTPWRSLLIPDPETTA